MSDEQQAQWNAEADAQAEAECEQAEAESSSAPAPGSAAPNIVALGKWMDEVTAILCHQPEVPMKHKEDLCSALNKYKQVLDAQRLAPKQRR